MIDNLNIIANSAFEMPGDGSISTISSIFSDACCAASNDQTNDQTNDSTFNLPGLG